MLHRTPQAVSNLRNRLTFIRNKYHTFDTNRSAVLAHERNANTHAETTTATTTTTTAAAPPSPLVMSTSSDSVHRTTRLNWELPRSTQEITTKPHTDMSISSISPPPSMRQNDIMKSEASPRQLPPGWVRRISKTKGKLYYCNERLRMTLWDEPTEQNIARALARKRERYD
jgi:hypothetical protein